jgi:hypothetical protein
MGASACQFRTNVLKRQEEKNRRKSGEKAETFRDQKPFRRLERKKVGSLPFEQARSFLEGVRGLGWVGKNQRMDGAVKPADAF